MKELLPSLPTDVAMISLDIDASEDADLLRRYADQQGFGWRFAVAPREMIAAFAQRFGEQFVIEPNEPMFIVDPALRTALLPFGHKEAEVLRALIARSRGP